MSSSVPVVTLVPLARAIGPKGRDHATVQHKALQDGVLVDGDSKAGDSLLTVAGMPSPREDRYWVPEGWVSGSRYWSEWVDPEDECDAWD